MSPEKTLNLVYAGDDELVSRIVLPDAVHSLQMEALAELPASNEPLLLVTSLAWLQARTPVQRAELLQMAAAAAHWLVVSHEDASDCLVLEWLQHGATEVVSRDNLAVWLQRLYFTYTAVWRDKTVWVLAGAAAEDAVRCTALRAAGLQVTTISTVDDLPATVSPALILCSDPSGLMLSKVFLLRTSDVVPVVCLTDAMTRLPLLQPSVLCLPSSIPVDQLVALVCQQISAASRGRVPERHPNSAQIMQVLNKHAIVSVADRKGRITAVNDRFCTISGYSREELMGQSHRLLKSGLHDADTYREMWSVITQGKAWQGVLCNRKKSGDLYWVEATIEPFFSAHGEIEGYVSIRTDVTPLKAKEEELNRYAEMLRQSQSFANIGTWDWNIKTGELYWSERIAPLFGYIQGEVETSYENFLGAVHPDDRMEVEQAVTRSVENNEPYDIEHRVIWQDGQERWLLERGAVTNDCTGNPLHMLGVVQDIHERKIAELALAQARADLAEANTMLLLVLDTIPARVFWKDRDLRYLGANQAFCRDAGMDKPEALIGLDDHDLPWSTGESTAYRTDDLAVMESHQPRLNFEEQQTTADGSLAWLRTSKIPLRNACGAVIGLLGVYEDITETRLAKQALKVSEERFSLAVEGAGDGIWDWNICTGAMTLSALYMSMLGYDEFELPHHIDTWINSVHPDDLERANRTMDEYLGGLIDSYATELRLRCKNDCYKWILCRATLVERDQAGQPLRMIGVHTDISPQKHLEENLSLFRRVFDVSDQCMVIADPKGVVLFVNQSYITTMGYSESELVGHYCKAFISEDESTYELVEKLLIHGGSWSGLKTRKRADGSEFISTNSFDLVKDGAGHVAYVFVIFSDFSVELARRDELAQAKEAAEKANRAKSEFLSCMSHELRTPMNAVIGFAQLLEFDEQVTPDQLDNIQEILKAGHHLLVLINDVLDLAKIEAGHTDLSLEAVDLNVALKECYDLTLPLAAQRQLRFEIGESVPWPVHADRVRLKQVLLNLISNAIKYNCVAGHLTLTTEATGEMVRVSVTDTGQGIAPERLDELFQPFRRISTMQDQIEGTGIGLTITRRLIEMMSGRIGVDSQPGETTTFWFELPKAQTKQQPAALVVLPSILAHENRPLTLLCIDDNPANLKLIEQVLTRWCSVQVITALEPEMGIELALVHRPDLILLDINMPRMDGYQVLRELRSHRAMTGVPIIAVTANAMPKDIKRGLAAGFNDYLMKPLNLRQTQEVIAKYLTVADAGGRHD